MTKQGMFHGASNLIFKNAKRLRNEMTPAENLLWGYLKGNQLGIKFRRQHPIDIYIADFYCHQLRLIIEVDGSIHSLPDVALSDSIRQKHLEALGLKVIRFSNADISTI